MIGRPSKVSTDPEDSTVGFRIIDPEDVEEDEPEQTMTTYRITIGSGAAEKYFQMVNNRWGNVQFTRSQELSKSFMSREKAEARLQELQELIRKKKVMFKLPMGWAGPYVTSVEEAVG